MVYSCECLYADLVPLSGSSGYHTNDSNKYFLKDMSVEIEFLLGTNPDEKLERRAPRTVSYVDISINSFFACADVLWDQTPRRKGKAGWLSGLKRLPAKKKNLEISALPGCLRFSR